MQEATQVMSVTKPISNRSVHFTASQILLYGSIEQNWLLQQPDQWCYPERTPMEAINSNLKAMSLNA